MKRVLTILIAAFCILGATSCERRPLVDRNGSFKLILKIALNVEVNGVIESQPEPEVMRVLFYDPNSGRKVTEDYVPAGGGLINIAPGNYDMLIYNFDTESTLVAADNQKSTILAYTNEISTAAKSNALKTITKSIQEIESKTKGDDENPEGKPLSEEDLKWMEAMKAVAESKIVYEPDHFFVARENITVLNMSGEQVIHAAAETIVETYWIGVRLKNRHNLASATALLTGQIESNNFSLPKEEGKTNTDVTLYFPMYAGSDAADNDIVYTTYQTFGKNPSVESRLFLTILITNSNGETYEWHKDITDEFVDNPEHIIYIEEDVIVVPDPENPGGNTGGGGFQPGVSEWEEEHHTITI